MVFAVAGMPTAASVAVVMGLPPGPLPGNVCGPPPSSVLPQALRRRVRDRMLLPRTSGLAVAKVRSSLIARGSASGEFDLAATLGRAGAYRTTHIRHDDARGGFAAQLARLIDGLLERRLHALGEFLQRLIERLRLDLEPERQNARRSQELRLAGEEHRARRIGCTVEGHRGEPPNAARPPVGEYILAVQALWIDLDLGKLVLRCHGMFRLDFTNHCTRPHLRSGLRTRSAATLRSRR